MRIPLLPDEGVCKPMILRLYSLGISGKSEILDVKRMKFEGRSLTGRGW